MSSCRLFIEKYESAKRELNDTEKTIRRLTGRHPDEIANSTAGPAKFRASNRTNFPARKRPSTGALPAEVPREPYDEESEEEENEESSNKKPSIQSTVVARRHQKRSRIATIEEQNANSKIKARNRRMFGALIGTLEKFQDEEKKRQTKESMRAEIEQKVEAATEEERERIKLEKDHLFVVRREKQTELRCLEKKIERAESYEAFEANHRHLLNHIMTKSKPPIFFLPSSHTPETKKCLEQSRSKIKELMRKQKAALEKDLEEIEECYRKDPSLPGDKENKCPKDEGDSQDVPETESESLVVEPEDVAADEGGSDSGSTNDDSNKSNTNVGSLTEDFEPIYD